MKYEQPNVYEIRVITGMPIITVIIHITCMLTEL